MCSSDLVSFVQNLLTAALLRTTLGVQLGFVVKNVIRMFNLNINVTQSFTLINTRHPGHAVCLCLCVDGYNVIPRRFRSEVQLSLMDYFVKKVVAN